MTDDVLAQPIRFHGGVHPSDGKDLSSGSEIRTAPLLERYVVPLQQHIGAPPKLLVAKKDEVRKGQLLAEPGGFVSAAIHSPTSGVVSQVGECLSPTGVFVPAVEIGSDGEDNPDDSLPPIEDWRECDPAKLLERVRAAGIVGMGGAAFPTHVKLSPPPNRKIDTLLLNGVECEPYLTADHRLMLEEPDAILDGAAALARVLGVRTVVLGIEENKPDAVALLRERAAGRDIEVVSLRVRYPQGAEKQLIYAATGRKVPAGGLPMDVGCVVQNVGTCRAVAAAVLGGVPLIERVVTVTGQPVVSPGNWRARVGTSLRDLLALAGGVKSDPAKIIAGGPMMGFSVYSLDLPISKSSSGILLLAPEQLFQYTSEPCINCGACVDVCPMKILPGPLSVQIENECFDDAENWRVMDCIECGCCAYACPANRPLVQHFKRAKMEIMARRR